LPEALHLKGAVAPGSGAEPLSPLGTPAGDDLAAAFGGDTGAETVTAFAHKLARLIGPLHGSFSAGRVVDISDAVGRGAKVTKS
jgi:hypothetical protein